MGKTKDSEVEERAKWDNKFQYMLTCIGFAVGLGNIWRFPYLCQIYGGGAFLIPYLIALVFEGLPLLYLELAIGQRLRMGSIGVWNSISPMLGGIGIASMIVSFLVAIFYNTILAWVLWYFFHSFQNPLPWSQCPVNANLTGYIEECVKSTPANYFWYRETLNITPDIETSGSLQWWLVICLASAWCMVYICIIRGIKSIGKAVYVTSTFPYLVLTIFLIRALTLPGSTDGLVYLFTPDWEILKNPQVWLDAATQIFFSLSVAFGGLISFSSYNEERNNCERDAVVVGVINSATSLYASISIFAILGFKATNGFNSCRNENIMSLTNHFEFSEQNITLENYNDWFEYLNRTSPDDLASLNLKHCDLHTFLDQSASGTGLAFIVITEAVIEMPGSQIWAILFFVMLYSLGLSSMFGTIEGVLTSINDLKLVPKWIPSEVVTAIVCLIAFSTALIFTLGSGNYWVEVFNGYVGSVPLLVIAFFEITAVAYGRGMKTFSEDIYFMTGKRPSIFWKACWMVISPLILLMVFVAYVAIQAQTQPSYPSWDPDYELFPQTKMLKYPDWVFAIIILLCVLSVISIPVVALYKLICCSIKKSSARGELNPYCNDSFEVETREQKSQTP
ncbi:sodium-dependent neutral amino acid transporter B(0)AT1-like [Pseudochaenichthys georgianus]|uniref:sodium-dependent neutral amino acid transporter B(0)AT1-like n=1 Tax=Pseudochaenichthys georgianus TaxID=52239 RepID=UPI00146E46DF|nr:sodium-dependent neutral amino acid transporter B(0)AT1-like [Pseudochaenichthys georgianus]